MSISVVYWSGTGNTQAMAEAVAEGIKAAGQEAVLLEVGDADAKTVAEEAAFALGCPAMGAEVLEESEMEPFVEELESLPMAVEFVQNLIIIHSFREQNSVHLITLL